MTRFRFEDGSFDDWYIIEPSDAEGTKEEMLRIAEAIEKRGGFAAKRCAIWPAIDFGFELNSPRNSINPVRLTLSEADDLARQIRARFATQPRPHLEALLGQELDEMERVCALGQAGKYAGKSIHERPADYHFDRAQSHALDGGVDLDELDPDTGAPHLLLAALRLMMATSCVKKEGERG